MDINAIKAMLADITQGEWSFDKWGILTDEDGSPIMDIYYSSGEPIEILMSNPDAAFIAAAPRIVRELVAELERLQASNVDAMRRLDALIAVYHETGGSGNDTP